MPQTNQIAAMHVTVPHEKVKSTSYGLIIATSYGAASMSMAFLNKGLMNTYSFHYKVTIVLFQMLFCSVLLEILRIVSLVNIPVYSLSDGVQFFFPSMLYAVHTVLALSALDGMNIAMYSVIRRCCPVATLLMGILILKKGYPGNGIAFSVMLCTVGFFISSYGDLAFDMPSYTYGGISIFTQSLYLVLVQKLSSDRTATHILYLNCFNTLPILLLLCLVNNELPGAFEAIRSGSLSFLLLLVSVITIGCLLNYLLFLCTMVNSALTTSLTGTIKSIIQMVIGMFTFGGLSINCFTGSGMTISSVGGVYYTYCKYQQSAVKN